MAKSKTEVVAEAHRRISVLSVDESPSTDMVTYASDAADSLIYELNGPPYNMRFFWDATAVPEDAFRPFAWLLAVDLAAHYQVPAEPRTMALNRLRGYAFPDDREDTRDTDNDGLLSDDEKAYRGAEYF